MGTEIFSDGLSLHAGGGAFITAAVFSALGQKSALLATLPAAPFTDTVLQNIAAFDIDTTQCVSAAAGTAPQITVAIADKADRAFLTHKTGAAMPEMDLGSAEFGHLHIGELRSLLEHPHLIERARQVGMTISVDCGWDDDILARGAEMEMILSKVDVFLPNKTEYEHLVRSGFSAERCSLTVVKCGDQGSCALVDGKWVSEPTTSVKVVDATGAGDAFNGGFLFSWLKGRGMKECLSNGNRCGRLAVTYAGGTDGISAIQKECLAG
jgi:sugar/nucleoside kinase (ribokinase family)